MKQKSFELLLYSAGGIVAMAVLLVAINLIASEFPARADLTQEKIYTLSPGTRAILGKLDTPVTIRFYCTRNVTPTAESLYLENYARQVEDLLNEYKQAAHGKIVIQKFDPEPDSDAEDSARLDGIEPETLPTGDKFYLGLAVSLLDAKQTVALSPDRQRLLEYDISRAISRVVQPQKPVVGVMSSLPVFGQQANPMMQEEGQQGTPPWQLINELNGDYTLRQVPLNTDKIDDDINVLLVIHPRGITVAGQYAIDQFVLRGGKLIAFLDPLSIADARAQNPMMGTPNTGASTLNTLLQAWGVHFDTSKVVADLNFKMQVADQNGQPADAPAFLDVTSEGINTNDIITSDLTDLWLPYAGTFTGVPAAGLKETVLVKSTKESELADAMIYDLTGDQILKNFNASGVSYALAIKLTGKFKTAFPGGPPTEGTNAVSRTTGFLKESTGDNTVILVGDADMLSDQFALRQVNSIFGNMAVELNDNLSFAQNAIGQMSGNSDLIAMRSRGVENRPFIVIKKMEAAAEMQYQGKIKELQDSLAATEQRLSELQQTKSQNQRYILSPEQQAQIENFQKQEAQVRSDLKQVQKDLRQDVVSLQTHIEWLNIAAMPALVSVFGLGLAAWKRKRTSAQ
jgi:gliding motility-associatede transport system auxiliary component